MSSVPLSRGPIERLKQRVAEMNELAVGMVETGTRALLADDRALAERVIEQDSALDNFDNEIEVETMRRIALLQPEGEDLRTLGAILKIGNCVDRIGRLGYDLARNVTPGPGPADQATRTILSEMDEKGRKMAREAIAAFLERDAARAKRVLVSDDEVDALYRKAFAGVVERIAAGGPDADRTARALLAARHLERVADNAVKIAEKAVYAITGERRPEYFPALAHRPAGPYSPP